ncbi:flavin reductase family protein [Amycolatopsis rubida]|uniref:Flavin reductase family protein n=1 Tax=Amycolatopsis rubida TaxID=112413 RepID=A0ABX0BMN0_9PSEU|nr:MULTISPECIES: flavin reductase family protein [Amycolatopsis]MYW90400.1 flavin reductase [Amycolatopsis rubida]NEC55377.1 flavin reductase family protein [Amycolatopsis rubida]OAP21864.1 Flavin-dependent monooxygenase, reductase subunit HsaB [Amycolatopsis sp. M39]
MLDQHFRDLMAGVCAPVAVVTTADGDGPHGATVSSLASLSLRPALISIALDRRSRLLSRIQAAGRFGVNVLSAGQDDLATVFAKPGADRFSAARWSPSSGLPRLDDVAGWAVCELAQAVPAGDHLLLVGQVVLAVSAPRPPLVYSHRTFGTHSRFAARPRTPLADHIAACSR